MHKISRIGHPMDLVNLNLRSRTQLWFYLALEDICDCSLQNQEAYMTKKECIYIKEKVTTDDDGGGGSGGVRIPNAK